MLKKIKYFYLYLKILNINKDKLKIEHDLSIDWVYRLYKTYNLTEIDIENTKSLGPKYFNDVLKKEINRIDKTFIEIGLSELIGLMEVIELNDNQVGMAFRFKFFNTAKLFKRIIWLLLYLIGGLIGFLFFSYLGIGIGLLSIFIIYLITIIFV
ncbi:hypothetical protein [Trichloromonas sp.]|uniref:hypothetical protein n=1 Tax=Trichloromonas sp. TaxID=3069249 RepID=UPI002A3CDDB0|nr:hypothetical protein [Trichloromonas sp.]